MGEERMKIPQKPIIVTTLFMTVNIIVLAMNLLNLMNGTCQSLALTFSWVLLFFSNLILNAILANDYLNRKTSPYKEIVVRNIIISQIAHLLLSLIGSVVSAYGTISGSSLIDNSTGDGFTIETKNVRIPEIFLFVVATNCFLFSTIYFWYFMINPQSSIKKTN